MTEVTGDLDINWRTDREDYLEVATDLDTNTRVPIEARTVVDDPWLAFRRARTDTWNVCFETRGEKPGWNWFGVEPDKTLTCWPEEISSQGSTSLEALTHTLDGEALHRPPGTPPVPGGWFGWISYDIARELESLPETTERDRDLPRLQFARFDTIAAWQSPTPEGPVSLRMTSCPVIGDEPERSFERGRAHIRRLVSSIADGSLDTSWGDPDGVLEFSPGCDRDTYGRRVRDVKEYIREGETFQVNLSQRFDAPATIHPVDTYEALRIANPAPYSGLIETPDVDLISTSPELLLERTGDMVRTEPIAGTRPRGDTPAADEALARELETDEKERAEHAMLVDLERNDLGKICEPGSVEVVEYRRVDRYASVWHLVSDVRGRMEPDVDIGQAIAAVIPGGTITGAPKPRTMEIIDELEERRRGPYTGSMAVIGFDGRIRANMIIRTLEHHDGTYRLRVGGGIVHDSSPDAEYDETLAKARAIREAMEHPADDPT